MGRVTNPTQLHLAIQANDFDSVAKYSATELLNVGCNYEVNPILSYSYCTPLHLAVLENRVKSAKILIEQAALDVNLNMQLIQRHDKHFSFTWVSTLSMAMQLSQIDIANVLLSHSDIRVNITELKNSIELLSQRHDDKYILSAIDVIRKSELQFLNTCVKKYEARKKEQKHVYSALFRGVPCSAKLAATKFVIDNLSRVLTLEKLPQYETHKRALTQGSGAHKSNLYKGILVIQQAELAINNVLDPHEKNEKELVVFKVK